MSEHTTTQCFLFPELFDRPLVAQFDQPQSSSDGGAIMLRAAERCLGLIGALAGCVNDKRQVGKELVLDELLLVACGYEDANDAARLASDPIVKLLAQVVQFRVD